MKKLNFQPIAGSYAVCKCASDFAITDLFKIGSILAFIRDDVETTIVLEQKNIQSDFSEKLIADRDWALFHIKGEFAFGETGIILSAIKPLSENNIGVFVLSTFSSDLLLIKRDDLKEAVTCLKGIGHNVL